MFGKIIRYYTEGFPARADFPPGLRGLLQYAGKVFEDMPPGVYRLLRLQPVAALGSGLIMIFLLRRGFEHVPVTIVFIILTFLFLAFGKYFFKKRTPGMMGKAAGIAVMFFVNDMLLFVLPFYFESVTFFSRNVFFCLIIAGLAFVSNWFYLLDRFILRSAFTSSIYYALVFFCVLNIIFPIIFGMRNIWSIALSGSISTLIAILTVYPHMRSRDLKNSLMFTSGLLLSFVSFWFGRSFIPPAPLKLMDAAACENVIELLPILTFTENNAEDIDEVFFFSSIFAPNGLSEGIEHVWYHDGRKLVAVDLKEITGGRSGGFRTWSRITDMDGAGEYTVEVWTAGGQLLGERSFLLR